MRRRPLFWFTVAFTSGILMTGWTASWLWLPMACLLTSAALFAFMRRPFWASVALLTGVLLLGSVRYEAARLVAANDVSHLAPVFAAVTGHVESDVDITRTRDDGTQQAQFAFRAVSLADSPLSMSAAVSGSIQVYLPPVAQADALPHYGDTVTIRGRLDFPPAASNPGAFDYRLMLARRGIYVTLAPKRAEDITIQREDWRTGSPILRFAYLLRQGVLRHGRKVLSRDQASVLNGILLGAKSDMPAELREDFERTGTAHILATAGLHVGILVWLLFKFLLALRFNRRQAAWISLFAVLLFALMAGGRPSVMRAALVASLGLLGFLLEREPDWWNITSVAALILLLYNPLLLFDPGFQLSFVTVITLVLLMPLFDTWLSRLRPNKKDDAPERLRDFLIEYFAVCFALSLAAQIATFPLFAYYDYGIPLFGFLANTTIVPFVAPIFALGFLAAGLAAIHPALAVPFDIILKFLLDGLMPLVSWWARHSILLPMPSLPVWALWLYYGALWYGLWRWLHRPNERRAGA